MLFLWEYMSTVIGGGIGCYNFTLIYLLSAKKKDYETYKYNL